MKIEFRRKVPFQVFDMMAELEVQEERKDIQDFLQKLQQSTNSESDHVLDRICYYLQEKRLLHKDKTLTEEGKKVLSTGFLFEPEEGKYRIWCVINDGFLETTMVYFERQKPCKCMDKFGRVQEQDVDKVKPLQLDDMLHKEHAVIPLGKNEEVRFVRIKRIGNDESCAGIAQSYARNSEPLELSWVWDGLKSSFYCWKGKLSLGSKILEIPEYQIPVDMGLEEIWKSLLEQNFYTWNTNCQRMEIPFGKENEAVYQNFKISKELNTDSFIVGYFDYAYASDIPVMPASAKDARLWRDFLVDKKLQQDYMIERRWNQMIREYNQQEEIKPYSLSEPSVEDFLGNACGKSEKRTASFWHLAAPYDLNPYGTDWPGYSSTATTNEKQEQPQEITIESRPSQPEREVLLENVSTAMNLRNIKESSQSSGKTILKKRPKKFNDDE